MEMLTRDNLTIRTSVPDDVSAIESLYPAAFPDEDLLPVVRDLLQDPEVATSIVGDIDSQVVGHVIFTMCHLGEHDVRVALLAPLAVMPAWHGRGIGSQLVRTGLGLMEDQGVPVTCVLGDPAYYGRFGFRAESLIRPPYPMPPEYEGAWQALRDSATAIPDSGELAVPRQWAQPSLWGP